MALLWIDGFDAYGGNGVNITNALNLAGYELFSDSNGVGSTAYNTTRTGVGFCMEAANNNQGASVRKNFASASGIVTGFACNVTAAGNQQICKIGYNNYAGTDVDQFVLYFNGANGLSAYINGQVYATPPNVVFQNVWQYIEIKYNPSGTPGTLVIKVDGVTQLTVSQTALFKSGSAAIVNEMSFGYDNNLGKNGSVYIDDWYLCDLSGASFNDFLGDCVVHALLPNSDTTTNQFALSSTGGDGTHHFSYVNELSPDGDASYIYSNTSGQKELFTIPALPSDIIEVLAVAVNVTARKQAPGLGTYAAVIDYGGNEAVAPTIATGLNYVTQQSIFTAPPGGGAWTLTSAQNATFGVKII